MEDARAHESQLRDEQGISLPAPTPKSLVPLLQREVFAAIVNSLQEKLI